MFTVSTGSVSIDDEELESGRTPLTDLGINPFLSLQATLPTGKRIYTQKRENKNSKYDYIYCIYKNDTSY